LPNKISFPKISLKGIKEFMARLAIWNPWEKDSFKKMFEGMGPNISLLPSDEAYGSMISVNLSEDEKSYVAEIPVPGLKPEDIDISLEDRYLTVSGETSSEEEEKNKKYHIREMSSASFSRTIMLPGNVDEEGIDAKCEHGILKIVMPKQTRSTSKRITVK
jgi:HSP20 family protein